MEKQEVRAVIKYFYFKGLTPQDIFTGMKETLGESAPAYSTVTKWYAEFKRGRSSREDSQNCGRPSTAVNEETAEKVDKLVMNDRRLSVDFIAESVGISIGSAHFDFEREFDYEESLCTMGAAHVIRHLEGGSR